MNEDLILIKRLESLREQHRELDEQIDAGGLDEFTRKRLQKMRLQTRDEISKLEKLVYPDIIAEELPDIRIEALGGLGDGLGQANGVPVFIAKTCPGDLVRASVFKTNQNGIQARLTALLEPGPERRIPPCPHFSDCGGCSLQHLSDESYRAFKYRVLQNALARAGVDLPASITFIPPASRRRVEFKIAGFPKPSLALYQYSSRELVPVKECPILDPILAALIAPINALLETVLATDLPHALSLTLADSGIDLLIQNPPNDTLAQALRSLPIDRIAVQKPDDTLRVTHERSSITMQLGGYAIPLPLKAFLQATREAQQLLTEIVLSAIPHASHVADLFCGIGTYSFPLSRIARVAAFEHDAAMVSAMRSSILKHRISSLHVERRDLFTNPLQPKELASFEAVILNPPRAGASAQVKALADSTVRTIVMISCNPATFARDAKILLQAGFHAETIQAIDQFVWSPHLEIAAVLPAVASSKNID